MYLLYEPPRLAMLFAVCSYTMFILVCVYVNKLLKLSFKNWSVERI